MQELRLNAHSGLIRPLERLECKIHLGWRLSNIRDSGHCTQDVKASKIAHVGWR